jgi:cytochrome c oxidase subunit 2
LRRHDEGREYRGRRRRAAVLALALPGVLFLSGCSKEAKLGFLPVPDKDMTNQTGRIINLWNGSWIAALAVGALVWGLMIWCMVVYRRRRDAQGLPVQVRYNIPLEILYTVVPIMMVGGLFLETASAQSKIIDTSAKPDVTINVIGKQWSWDFVYPDSNVYESGIQLEKTPGVNPDSQLPVLYLPVNKRVEFLLTSRDVVHSFWVPAFLFKMDTIPGVQNKYQVVPQRTGTFAGKCSELCGEYHSDMLFSVKVVNQQEYDQHMADLKAAGNVGSLDTNLGRSDTSSGRGHVPFNPSAATTKGTESS